MAGFLATPICLVLLTVRDAARGVDDQPSNNVCAGAARCLTNGNQAP
ncbi:MAG TPA: hypothetical protein VGF59_03520 [Bryobacteraceae bacterium]|jgi:hypothetical protein